MGFLDNITDKIAVGSVKVAEKAKEGYEYASLQATVEKEKLAQEKLYNEIGKIFATECKDILNEKYPELSKRLEESIKKAEDAKEAIRNRKGAVVCPGCGKEVNKDARFCPACGAVVPECVSGEACMSKPQAEESSKTVE